MPDSMGAMDIAFPHLGIYLEDVPKSFSVFGFEMAFYGLVIGIGVIMGVLMAEKIAQREGLDTEIVWDFFPFAVFFSVVGARIYYVIFSWDSFQGNLLAILNLRQGGLAIYGGVIGAFITLFIFCKVRKISPFQLGDCGVHGLVLGQIIGRWGNFFNREAFGRYTDGFFAMRLPLEAVRPWDMDQSHLDGMAAMGEVNFIQVHPTFLYEGAWNFCLLTAMILYHKKKKYHGQMCLFYLGGYGIGRFFIEGLRTDQLLIPGTQIAVSQVLGLILFIAAVVMDVMIRMRQKKERGQQV